jgi:hypothetical protein
MKQAVAVRGVTAMVISSEHRCLSHLKREADDTKLMVTKEKGKKENNGEGFFS